MGRVADLVVIDRMPGAQPAQADPEGPYGGVNDLLTVDGSGGSDRYLIYLFGGEADSLINVFDTGAARALPVPRSRVATASVRSRSRTASITRSAAWA